MQYNTIQWNAIQCNLTESRVDKIIPSCCHLPVSCRSLVERCDSLGSCKPQIYFYLLFMRVQGNSIYTFRLSQSSLWIRAEQMYEHTVKIHQPQSDLNPRTLYLEASTLPRYHPRPTTTTTIKKK